MKALLKSAGVKTILKTAGSSVKEFVDSARFISPMVSVARPDKSSPASTTLSRSQAWGQA
jgi:hypothetical protein